MRGRSRGITTKLTKMGRVKHERVKHGRVKHERVKHGRVKHGKRVLNPIHLFEHNNHESSISSN